MAWPSFLSRPYIVTVHLRHGQTFDVRCREFSIRSHLDQSITRITTDGRLPFYVQHDEIVLITSRRGWW